MYVYSSISMATVSSGSLHGGERRAERVQVALGLPMLRGGAEGYALVFDDVTDAEAVGDHRAETEEAQHLRVSVGGGAEPLAHGVCSPGAAPGRGGGAVCPRVLY